MNAEPKMSDEEIYRRYKELMEASRSAQKAFDEAFDAEESRFQRPLTSRDFLLGFRSGEIRLCRRLSSKSWPMARIAMPIVCSIRCKTSILKSFNWCWRGARRSASLTSFVRNSEILTCLPTRVIGALFTPPNILFSVEIGRPLN
jgi:hypothetical protein